MARVLRDAPPRGYFTFSPYRRNILMQTGPDTIRILIATDSHVGYNERDLHRGDDSWQTFHEVMSLAKEHDVDMVLHAGDLFHENKPSRKSLFHVLRSLRMNCLGDKPCELEMLSDASENFGGLFDHVNYEDPDINVAIPVFAIHGNHDDPSGEGSYSALDLLQVSGLVNYYGRQMENDKVSIKPVLLQKGKTKLALYGMSNIRDERMFRTFRDGNVKFFQPSTHKDEWFNLMSVHQNHHAYTETGYLPENFLPDFMDFVVWGHEHECKIDPIFNPEMGFHVMQPGSSVATSLMPGEAVPKHVAILSIKRRDFHSEPIRLTSVRPFVMKEIVLAEEQEIKDQELWKKSENRVKVTQYLENIVDGLIKEAEDEWRGLQNTNSDEEVEVPRPLIRLRVEYSAPEAGQFQCENPQRFSTRFIDRVANTTDVVQFYRKKHNARPTLKNNAELPDESVMAQLALDSVKVEKLVREFLEAQSLTILPQNSFGDAVAQFVDKDDKHAMEMFVNESLATQLKYIMERNDVDEDDITNIMEQHRADLEERFASGQNKKTKKRKLKPKPDTWDSDFDGSWADQPGALIHTDAEDEGGDGDLASIPPKKPAAKGRAKAATQTQKKTAAPKKTVAPKKAPAKATRGRRQIFEEEEDDEVDDDDVIMLDDDDDEEEEEENEETLFVKQPRAAPKRAPARAAAKPAAKAPARTKSPPKKPAARSTRQTTLDFSQSQAPTRRAQPAKTTARGRKVQEPVGLTESYIGLVANPWVAASSRCHRPKQPRPGPALASTMFVRPLLFLVGSILAQCAFFSPMISCHCVSCALQEGVTRPSPISCFPSPSQLSPTTLICLPSSCHPFFFRHCCDGSWIATPSSLVQELLEVSTYDTPPIGIDYADHLWCTMSYKVEELLALRDSVSESAVSLDKFADEDVIKEHVLRPSVSANNVVKAPSFERPLRASATPGVSSANTNLKKPSPSPSVKRGKAERLLKEHGSPPGMRVTAGGRVVPSDLPPLGGARFGNNNFRLQGVRNVDLGNAMAPHMQSDANSLAPQVQILGNQAVIRVGDKVYPLPTFDSNYGMPPVLPSTMGPVKPAAIPSPVVNPGIAGLPLPGQSGVVQYPWLGFDLPTLESHMAAKRDELRYIEQTEVLQAEQQGPVWRNQMIQKKKSVITELDFLRKQILALKEEGSNGNTGANTGTMGSTAGPSAATTPGMLPTFPPQLAPSVFPNVGLPYTAPGPNAFQPFMMYPPFAAPNTPAFTPDLASFGRDSQFYVPGESTANTAPFSQPVTQAANPPHSPGSASRRSHAVPIKKPQDEGKKSGAPTSTLDPKSPTYEPMPKAAEKSDNAQSPLPPTPSPPKSSQWAPNETGSGLFNKLERRDASRKASLSSIDTTDFFPNNTHEHSSTRVDPQKVSKQSSRENVAVPATPDKDWSNGPWNPPSEGRPGSGKFSVPNESARRFTSWPEAFGNKESGQISARKPSESAASAGSALPKNSAAQRSADLVWPSLASKPVPQMPVTYQEGYQAGLSHMGLPANAEVLNGYVDGLLALLNDQGLRDRKDRSYMAALLTGATLGVGRDTSSARSSLRGYLSGATLHDSPVSFVENLRAVKTNSTPSAGIRQTLYNNATDGQEAQATCAFAPAVTEEQYARAQAAFMNQTARSRGSPANTNQQREEQLRQGLGQSPLAYPRQVSGNQAGTRTQPTPVSMQRFFPATKDYAPGYTSTEAPRSARMADHHRLSGYDGAMDDLAGLSIGGPSVTVPEQRVPAERAEVTESSSAGASCFKPSSSKGKQAASSPAISHAGYEPSPTRGPASPRKSGEQSTSPAKARLEQVTNKLRRPRKDDPRTMSPEDKQKHSDKWRQRFRKIKAKEEEEMREYYAKRESEEGSRR
ncbi:hypothetical protein M011DRAFT_404190 [Sporormia fimetaria CBS 119925]|uniref:Mre11 DNA-binding domain-containing protein n=1 Tax=Sporormia fimetaria CBS 119925 TaxID=1340428 RepID=A0A6A6V7F5_9PLEO|nr:hypothetical protein M011DRAFT_404190 [Sporormia fimetaria CBS 119925]